MIFTSLLLSASGVHNNLSKSVGFWESLKPPEDISTHGHLIDELFNYVTILNVFYFSLVCLGIFGFSFLYNAKKHPKALYTYGTKKKHVLITLGIASSVFLSVDMYITKISNTDYTNVFINWPDETKEDVVRIEVMGQQWMWNFRYAGKDQIFNTEDDVLTVNDLRVPIDKKVVFQIISKDVIHSLFMPNTRRKVDAIPGRITRMWFELKKAGIYPIACAEMCGTYHYRMQAQMTSYASDDFDRWLSEAEDRAVKENDLEVEDLFWGWKWNNKGPQAGATQVVLNK